MLADCKQEYGWNVDPFDRLVGLEQSEIFLEELGSIKQGKNILIWLPNAQGNFSTRSAWECIRARALTTPWSNWNWHPALPKKFLCWCGKLRIIVCRLMIVWGMQGFHWFLSETIVLLENMRTWIIFLHSIILPNRFGAWSVKLLLSLCWVARAAPREKELRAGFDVQKSQPKVDNYLVFCRA